MVNHNGGVLVKCSDCKVFILPKPNNFYGKCKGFEAFLLTNVSSKKIEISERDRGNYGVKGFDPKQLRNCKFFDLVMLD